MAIETESTIDVGTNTVFKIGLSKFIGQYSEDEIWNYPYCSSQWRFYQHIGDTSYEDYAPGGAGEPYNLQFPLKWVARNTQTGALDFDPGEIAYNQPGGIYARIIWLYSSTSPISRAFPNFNRSITSGSSVNIITSMDMTRCRLHCYDVVIGNYITHISPNDQTNYVNFDEFKIIEHVGSTTNYEPPSHGVIFPAIMFKWNNKLHIHRLFQDMYRSLDWSWWLSTSDTDKSVQGYEWNAQSQSFDGQQGVYFPINIYRQFTNLYPMSLEDHESWTVDFNGDVGAIYQWQYGYHTGGRINPANQNTYLEAISWYGMMFEHKGVQYKPIIENGYVTGYTDNMDAISDIDNYTGETHHNVPPSPPSPSESDADNNDPIPVAAAPYASGLARYYVTTAASPILAHISAAMGAWNLKDTGKDLYRNIISCKLIKSPAPIPTSGSEPFTVYGIALQYEGSDITLPVVSGNPSATFGPYRITRKFNDFRDFAPYTKVEIYLPYCGWTVLPSHVVGKSVSVKYYTDIIAATCKAIVYCGTNVVAEAAGVIGLDIPMITENAGAKAEAVTMGLLAYGKAGLQTAIGVGAAVASKGKVGVKSAVGGLENLVSAYSQTAMAFNQNYTEINGKNGDGCCIAGISAIVIKITRPKYGSNTTPPYVPSEYPHSTGYVSMKSAKVGSFTGLLVADNVDTSGISGATDREKQLIKLYLESGIYVNHPS